MEKKGERHTTPTAADGSPTWHLERWALRFQEVLLRFCLFFHCIDRWETRELKAQAAERKFPGAKRRWDLGRALWVVVSLMILVGCWYWNPSQRWAMVAVGGVATARFFEILVTSLGTALGQQSQVRARNLVTIAIYGMQLTLIFAIAYHSFAETGFVATDAHKPLTSFDYLFISWSAFTSLGTEAFEATTETARFLQVATTTAGILLLGVLLAFGINEVQEARKASG